MRAKALQRYDRMNWTKQRSFGGFISTSLPQIWSTCGASLKIIKSPSCSVKGGSPRQNLSKISVLLRPTYGRITGRIFEGSGQQNMGSHNEESLNIPKHGFVYKCTYINYIHTILCVWWKQAKKKSAKRPTGSSDPRHRSQCLLLVGVHEMFHAIPQTNSYMSHRRSHRSVLLPAYCSLLYAITHSIAQQSEVFWNIWARYPYQSVSHTSIYGTWKALCLCKLMETSSM